MQLLRKIKIYNCIVYKFFIRLYVLKRAEHGAHVARRVVIHRGEYDGVHERNRVLGAVGGDAQQHVGAEHVEQKHEVRETGTIKHWLAFGYTLPA